MSLSYQNKDGRVLLVWHQLFNFFFFFFLKNSFFFQVGVIPKEGWMVWQWLRTLETFSCNAAQVCTGLFTLRSATSSHAFCLVCFDLRCKRDVLDFPYMILPAPWPPMGVLSMGLEHFHRGNVIDGLWRVYHSGQLASCKRTALKSLYFPLKLPQRVRESVHPPRIICNVDISLMHRSIYV